MNKTFVDTIKWTEFKTKEGKPFRVGVLENLEENSDNVSKNALEKNSFDISVNWQVSDSEWKYTDDRTRQITAISRYALYKDPSSHIYNYTLVFTNNKNYDYCFYDDSGDAYTCNCFRTGDHYMSYNSDYPNIIRITGY